MGLDISVINEDNEEVEFKELESEENNDGLVSIEEVNTNLKSEMLNDFGETIDLSSDDEDVDLYDEDEEDIDDDYDLEMDDFGGEE